MAISKSLFDKYTVRGAIKTAPGKFGQKMRAATDLVVLGTKTGISGAKARQSLDPYSQAIAENVYSPPGLGDGSSWADVAKAFVAPIGDSLGKALTKGRGQQAPVVNVAAPVPATSFPTWAKLALGGVGFVGLFMLLRRR